MLRNTLKVIWLDNVWMLTVPGTLKTSNPIDWHYRIYGEKLYPSFLLDQRFLTRGVRGAGTVISRSPVIVNLHLGR
jgi:hypothetical protein